MKIEFAPLDTPWSRRLETLCMAGSFSIMMFGWMWGTILLWNIIFHTSYWLEAIMYIFWIYVIDIAISDKGGRRIEWTRSWAFWKHLVRYFPVTLHKSSNFELDPQKNYLFGCFPHGILPTGCFSTFGTNWGGFQEMFPNHTPYLLTLKQLFLFPVVRELFLASGFCSVSKDSLNYLLGNSQGGNVAAMLIGGAAETFNCNPGTHKVVLKNRKGFAKVALINGAPLVPVYSFGETEIYRQVDAPKGGMLRNFQEWIKSKTGIVIPVLLGRGLFQYSFGIFPFRKPINVVVGEPIEVERVQKPSQEQIDELHEQFMERLGKLFEENKHKFIQDHEKAHLLID